MPRKEGRDLRQVLQVVAWHIVAFILFYTLVEIRYMYLQHVHVCMYVCRYVECSEQTHEGVR